VKFAKVQLYSSSGKVAWVGVSDKDGGFATGWLPPDEYRIEAAGWGSATVRLNPELGRQDSQTTAWTLQLMDNACISYIAVTN
jgi:hypothetical protein